MKRAVIFLVALEVATMASFQAVVSKSTPTDLRAETLTVGKVTRDMR